MLLFTLSDVIVQYTLTSMHGLMVSYEVLR